MNQRSNRFRRGLVFAVAALLAWQACAIVADAQQRGDPFAKSNEAKVDPFSALYQAPPIQLTTDKKPNNSVNDTVNQKDAPPDAGSVNQVIDFTVTAEPKEVRRGEVVHLTVTGVLRKTWHTYTMTVRVPEQELSRFIVGSVPGLQPLGPITENEPTLTTELSKPKLEHDTKVIWSFDVLVQPDAKVGPTEFPFKVHLMACNPSRCLNPDEIPLKATFTVLPGDPVTVTEDLKNRAKEKFPPRPADYSSGNLSPSPTKTSEPSPGQIVGIPRDYQASIERIAKKIKAPQETPSQGLLAFMLAGMFWGFVSLITPCVFPMIPITVSFFLKQSEKEHHNPLTMAAVYCGTIVIVLTIAAAALLSFFRVLSINPLMNFGLGLLFVFFALSLFGMYDIELPSFLARFTSERESRGGMVGTIFMALTFTIISFACVAPFLGGFGGTANTTSRPFWHTILGGLAFAVTFASPFFILALFPTLLKAMPKSGSWLNSVKVVMGFLELAAAFKFFRTGELVLTGAASIFTFDLVLGLWVALCFLCGLYLLGVYRLPHDSPAEHLSVPRMLFSFVFLGLGLYFLPGLFVKVEEGERPRPNGAVFAWVNSFLLPEARPAKDEVWTGNLEDAIAKALDYRKKTGIPKFVFIDFTGVSCTNCNLNENDVFNQSEIQQLFKQFELVKLYTDTIPLKYYSPEDRTEIAKDDTRVSEDAKVNRLFEKSAFNSEQLPLYVILEPLPDGTIRVVGPYDEGRIMNVSAFAEFLRQPHRQMATSVASR
jgi:thiol:disulfide interchange protein DsbD